MWLNGLYISSRTCTWVQVNRQYSNEFVGVGKHQVSFLYLLLFILMLEAMPLEVHRGLYDHDLAELTHSKLTSWKDGIKGRGLRVNMIKMKLMTSGSGLDLYDSGAVCSRKSG